MSRVAKNPVIVPKDVVISFDQGLLTVQGSKGSLSLKIAQNVQLKQDEGVIQIAAIEGQKDSRTYSGTIRALVANMVHGVSVGFEKKLELVGVGYRAKSNGAVLNLTLGYSHPIDYEMPPGVTVETPSQTEIILKSANKQQLGEVAAKIRSFRPPEPYKGKGIRLSDETIIRKEAKKK